MQGGVPQVRDSCQKTGENQYRNWLLAALTPAELALLGPLACKPFDIGYTAIHAHIPAEYFWFLEGGFFSIQRPASNGHGAEIGYVGNNGCFAVQSNLTREAFGLNFVAQRSGSAWLARLSNVQKALEIDGNMRLRKLFRDAAYMAMRMMAISVICYRWHSEEQRIIRRVLAMTRDDPQIELTHEFFGDMVAASRETVGKTIRRLADDGLIRYGRGWVEVLDWQALASRTCECFEEIERVRADRDRLRRD